MDEKTIPIAVKCPILNEDFVEGFSKIREHGLPSLEVVVAYKHLADGNLANMSVSCPKYGDYTIKSPVTQQGEITETGCKLKKANCVFSRWYNFREPTE